jgi:hypothetical protein
MKATRKDRITNEKRSNVLETCFEHQSIAEIARPAGQQKTESATSEKQDCGSKEAIPETNDMQWRV